MFAEFKEFRVGAADVAELGGPEFREIGLVGNFLLVFHIQLYIMYCRNCHRFRRHGNLRGEKTYIDIES